MRALILIAAAGLVSFIPRSAMAWDHNHGEKNEKKHWKHSGDDDDDRRHHRRYGDACFRDGDLRVMQNYYRARGLPPGLEKKYYRTGQLPPGWEKKIQPFPYVIERSLPPLCAECARGYMDGYAVVYQPRSRVIIDIHAVFGLGSR